MMLKMDKDKSGNIEYAEFEDMMKKKLVNMFYKIKFLVRRKKY